MLVRAAVDLGRRAGLSALVTGLTIVAVGTSAPELAVSIDAVLVGSSDIAIGNVVGSNFANIALVLALSALLKPISIEPSALRRDLPVMMLCFALAGLLLLPDRVIQRWEGGVLVLAIAAYVMWLIRVSRRQFGITVESGSAPASEGNPGLMLLVLAGGIVLLSLGGHWLVEGAVQVAARFGVSEAIIGMTVVAVGTSLPEITASIISILRGHGSMAVGNVVGSNIWNTLGVLGTTALVAPLPRGDIAPGMLAMMVGAGLLLWLFCATGKRIIRLEGAALLAGYIACQFWLFS